MNFSLAGIVLTARKRRPAHVWAAILAISVGFWAIGIALFLNVENSEALAAGIVRCYYVIAATIALALIELALFFPRPQTINKLTHTSLFIGYGVAVLASLHPEGLVGAVHLQNGMGNTVELQPYWYGIYVLYFLEYTLIALGIFATSYFEARARHQSQLHRQLRTMLIGIVLALGFGSLFNLILPFIGNYELIWAGPPFALLFVAALFYAIIRQGLFDLRATFARSSAYGLTLLTVALFYGTIILGATKLFFEGQTVTTLYAAVFVVIALVLSLTYAPIKRFFDRLTHRMFYRDDYDLGDTLTRLSTITSGEMELRRLVGQSLAVLEQALSSEYLTVYATDNDGKLHQFNAGPKRPTPHQRKVQLDVVANLLNRLPRVIDVREMSEVNADGTQQLIETGHTSMVLQLVVQQERIGAIFIGDKQSGRTYDDKDMQLLSTMADELALAIQNSFRFSEIQHFNETLKERVNAATLRLRKTNRELQRLDEAKDQFVSIASHQLRTPLTSIKGYVSMVLEGDAGKVTDTQRYLLGEAFESSERMVRLIADFLSVSRLQTGKFILDQQKTDLDEVIRHEVASLQEMAKIHNLRLVYDAPKSHKKLFIDEAKVRQVIMNFIDNAIYYSRAGGRIDVSLAYEGDQAILRVHDEGIGVPAAEQEKLFGKFYRASNARKQRPDGTGVGLFLAKKVISSHDGAIIFESKEGEGSTFGFTLPLHQAPIDKRTIS